jgi:hypothetical protein
MAKSWEQPPFPNWNAEFIDRILTDSPWAKQFTVTFRLQQQAFPLQSDFAQFPGGGIGLPTGIPGVGWPGGGSRIPGGGGQPRSGGDSGGLGSRAEMYLTARWSSALPVRQALALQQFGRGGLDHPKALELLNRPQNDHLLEIFGFPTIVYPQGGKVLEQQLRKTAQLAAGSGRVQAKEVEMPEHGMHLLATIWFPRLKELTENDGVIKLTAQAGGARIEQQFKLKPMIYRGTLEI